MEANLIALNYLNVSHQYYQDHLKWCMSIKPIPPELNFPNFFREWYVVVVPIIVLSFAHGIAYFAQVFEYPRHDCYTIFLFELGCFCSVSYNLSPKSIPVRIGLMAYAFGHFCYASIIGALLMHWILKPNYYPKFNSFKQVIDAEYNLSGDTFAFAKLSTTNDFIDPLILNERFSLCESADICLDQLHTYQDMAVAISNEYFRSISNGFNTDIYCLSVNGFSSGHSLNFLLGNNFKFKAELNRFIQMANEGGLIFKWMTDFSSEDGTQYEYITQSEISMAHIMLAVVSFPGSILLSSLIVFLAEILFHRLKTRPEFRKFCAFAEFMCNADRQFLNYDLRYMLPLSYDIK